jgi:hypothetical protein
MQLQDVSAEVAAVKASLTRVVEEGADSDHGTPTPTPSPAPTSVAVGCEEAETALLELVQAEKWAAALRHARHNRYASTAFPVLRFIYIPFSHWILHS